MTFFILEYCFVALNLIFHERCKKTELIRAVYLSTYDLDMKGRLCIKMIFCLKIVGLVVFNEIFHKALQNKIMKSVGIYVSLIV